MAESGVQCGSGNGSEVASNGSNRYLELSLSGRWLTLARKWLEDHCPCTVSEYYAKCAPLMPTHIADYRKLADPKYAAAKDALARLAKGTVKCDPVIKVTGESIAIISARKKRPLLYDYSWVPEEADIGATIDLKTFGFDHKRLNAGQMMLKKKGYVCIGKNVYEYRGKENQ